MSLRPLPSYNAAVGLSDSFRASSTVQDPSDAVNLPSSYPAFAVATADPHLDGDIVFIDAGVEQPEYLAQGVVAGVESHILLSDEDAIATITNVLQRSRKVGNIHIVSHGSPGCLYLGKGELSLSTLADYAAALSRWCASASGRPRSLLLYGCNVAAGDAGAEFLEKLHRITGAEVFASAHPTGHGSRGGDWRLEQRYGGRVEALAGSVAGSVAGSGAIAFTPELQASYPGIFSPVNLSANLTEGTEAGTTAITLTVTADAAVTGDQTVRLNLDGISSTATGSDFTGLNSQITIPNGQTEGSLTFTVKDDASVEGLETAEFFISNPSSGITLGSSTSVSINVVDDEQPQVNLKLDTTPASATDPASTSEADGTTITLTAEATQVVQGDQTLDLVLSGTADGTDFSGAFPTSITIPDGQREGVVSFSVADDGLIELLETATFTLATGAASSGVVLGPVTEASLEITDNDAAGFTVTESAGSTVVAEPTGTDSLDVVLTAQPLNDVVITVANSNPLEASADANQLTFTTTNWNQPQTITVAAVDDDVVDGTQTSTLTLAVDAAASDAQFGSVAQQTVTLTSNDDDAAGITLSNTTGLTTTEAGGTASFDVQLDSQPTANVTLTFASGDPTEGTVASPITFTPANWNVAQTLTVTGQDDALSDGDVGYSVTTTVSSSDSNYDGLAVAAIALTNSDNDTPGFTITNAPVTVAEPSTSGSFSLVLDAQPSSNVVLQLSSNDPSEATVASPITFTPTNWNIAQPVTVTAVDDDLVDGPQTSQITVAVDAAGSDAAFGGIASQTVSVTTTDDDTVGFTVTPGSTTVSETGTATSLTLVLDAQPSSDVILSVGSSDPGEATVSAPAVTFTTSDWNVPQTVTVTGVDDIVVDGDQVSQITIAVDGSSDSAFTALAPQTIAITTSDDEIAGFTLTPVTGSSLDVDESGSFSMFAVALNAEPTSDVVLNVVSSDPTEAIPDFTSLTFTPTDWNVNQTVAVSGVDDSLADGDKSADITVAVDAASSADAYDTVSSQSVPATIADDEVPSFSVTETSGNTTVDEAGGLTDSFDVVLDVQPETPVVLTVANADPGEATVSTPSLTFDAINWDQPQTVTVAGVADGSADGPQTSDITIAVDAAASADPFDGLAPQTIVATIQDSDVPGFSVIQSDNVTEVMESGAGSTDSVEVRLNVQPQSDVVIAIANSDTNATSLSANALTFTNANWDQPQTVTVTGVDNSVVDGDRPSTLTLSIDPAQSDDAFDSVVAQTVGVTTKDDDVAGFTITESDGATTVSESGATDTFDAVLTAEPSSDVILTVASGNLNEATVDLSSLTFTASDWNIPQTVTVTGVDDSAVDGNQSTDVTLGVDSSSDSAFTALASETVAVTTIDDDEPGITITPTTALTTTEAGATAELDVVLNKQPSADVTVSFSSDAPDEGTAPASITFTPADWDQVQTVTVTGVDDSQDDGDVSYAIAVSITSDDAGYAALTPAPISLTNIDDDENSAPVLVNEIPDQQAEADVLFDFLIPVGTFNDPDADDILTYQALELSEGSLANLPSWLTFDPTTQRFSGTPTAADVGSIDVQVKASDAEPLSEMDLFTLTVTAPPEPEPVPEPEPAPEPAPEPEPEPTPPTEPVSPTDPTPMEPTPMEPAPTDPLPPEAEPLTEPLPTEDPSPIDPQPIDPVLPQPISDPSTPQSFSLQLTQGQTEQVNELIVVQTDANGSINGIAPGAAGYDAALLQQASVVFSTLKQGRIPDLSANRTLELPGNGTFQFAVIENGSLDSLRQGGAGTLQLATLADSEQSLVQAAALLTATSPLNLQVPLTDEDGNVMLNSLVLEAGASSVPPLGSGLQGNSPESELLDFRNETGTRTATFEVYRDAKYDNLVGLYFVENEQGQVRDSLGGLLNPGDAGYVEAALANRLADVNLTGTNGAVETFSTEIAMGQLLAPFIVVDGTVEELLDSDSGNDPSIYFTHMGANSDGVDHVRLIGDNTFGFEDLAGGGDMDFDDIVMKTMIV